MKGKFKAFIYLILIITLSGCKSQETEFKMKDLSPEVLSRLNNGINKILKDIGDIEKVNMGLEVENKAAIEDEKNGGDAEEASQDSSEESSGEEGDKNEKNPPKDSKQEEKGQGMDSENQVKGELQTEKKWKEINKTIEGVHEDWGNYASESIKKGILKEKREQFEKSINKTTKAIEDKSIMDIYDFGSQSLQNLKPFFDAYNDEISGDINEIKYSVYQFYVKGVSGKKKEAIEAFNGLEENINKIRFKLKDKDKKLEEVDNVIFSLESMEKALEENSKQLLTIKKDVGIRNIETLE